ncbi:MAG: RNA polymerase sigma factor region1.1 domain-containing protein, partial [Pseudomonadota bacterium]
KGFLTYGEINDHLPEDIHDTDQIEAVVSMINDMGIQVYDEAPDPETLLLKTEPPPAEDEDEAAEQAEQVAVSAVESEFGRTTDPVRMYMREMGTVELLTREGEIDLAKRIEDGVRQTTEAIAACPAAIAEVVRMMDLVEADQMRLTDLVVDFVDPDAVDMPLPQVTPKAAVADDEEEETEAGTTATEEEDTGPDREEAMIRFTRIRRLYPHLLKTIEKKGYDSPEIKRLQKKLADEFMQIKFVPKQVNRLVEHVRSLVEQAREQEKVIMDVCVARARMPRKTFLKLFPGNETNKRWVKKAANCGEGNGNVIENNAEVILAAQDKLKHIEERVGGMPISELKEINRRMS